MKCPVCAVDLNMSERQGIEIDYCPGCRGVWLDRGELDKIIERSQAELPAREKRPQHHAAPAPAPAYGSPTHHYQKPYKKKSLLSELFDFD